MQYWKMQAVMLISKEKVWKIMHFLISAFIICSAMVSTMGVAFAQTAGPEPQQVLGIYAQIKVEDSAGNLVSYLETSNMRINDASQFNQIIDENINQFKKTPVNVGGQDIEILQVNESRVLQSSTIISLNIISLKTPSGPKVLVVANHDGFPVAPGDKMTTYWTIVRTAGS